MRISFLELTVGKWSKWLHFPFVLVTTSMLTSCVGMYGLHDQRDVTAAQVIAASGKRKISSAKMLDSNYVKRLKETTFDRTMINNFLQPLQFWLYRNDSLIYGEPNCYTGGFPNLHWHFISTSVSPLGLANYPALSKHAQLLGDNFPEAEGTLIIVWSEFMGRQNVRFLKNVQNYLARNKNIVVHYYNADNVR